MGQVMRGTLQHPPHRGMPLYDGRGGLTFGVGDAVVGGPDQHPLQLLVAVAGGALWGGGTGRSKGGDGQTPPSRLSPPQIFPTWFAVRNHRLVVGPHPDHAVWRRGGEKKGGTGINRGWGLTGGVYASPPQLQGVRGGQRLCPPPCRQTKPAAGAHAGGRGQWGRGFVPPPPRHVPVCVPPPPPPRKPYGLGG